MKRAYLFVAAAAILYGFITVGGRLLADLGFSLYEVSLFPMLTVAVLLGITGPRRTPPLFGKDALGFFAIYGVIGACLQITQYGGILLGVPVAVVAMLLYTQPIWTMLMSRLWLGERITKPKVIALIVAIAGIVLLLNPLGVGGTYNPIGLLSALLGGVILGIWVIWTKRSEVAGRLPPATKVYGYALFTTAWLLVMFPLAKLVFRDPEFIQLSVHSFVAHWPVLLLMAGLAYIIPYTLLFHGIHEVDAPSAGTLLMLEPVSAALLAALIFHEPLTWNIFAGGLLILLSDFIIVRFDTP